MPTIRSTRLGLLLFVTTLVAAPATSPPEARAQESTYSPCAAPQARDFDFWRGEWNVVNRYLTPDGWVEAGTAEVRVYSALAGCLTIEQWRGNLGTSEIVGFSARAWDERAGHWVLLLNWPQPDSPSFSTLEGTFRHGRGEFFADGLDAEGNPRHTRFSFSDISPDSLRWDQAVSADRENWRTTWIMDYSRRSPNDPPVLTDPSPTDPRCSGEPHRQLDGLLGEWSAETEIPRRSGEPRRQTGHMRTIPILDGCAMLEFFEAQAPDEQEPFMTLRVRAWVGDRWVQYWYDNQERIFQRFEGVVDAGEEGRQLVLESRPDPDGARVDRIVWTGIDSDAPVWTFTMSLDGGATFRQHAMARMSR